MILLDENNKPENTVYYLSGIIYRELKSGKGFDYSELYNRISDVRFINVRFFSLALDFLFLIDKIKLDEKGELYVPENLENN